MSCARRSLKPTLLGLLLMWVTAPSLAANDALAPLLQAGTLMIETSIEPTQGLVPGQKATLTFKVSTNRWFVGGTRISIPEVPGLVILQTEQFASNASENRGGESWVVQRWNLDVYPQREGDFTIAPVKLRVKVNADGIGDVEGDLYSQAVDFPVSVPPSLAQAPRWVASPSFSVNQNFSRTLEGLSVGDAFEQEIVFEANDVLAMMLPEVPAEKLPGLAVYPSPPKLANDSNRGQVTARRSQVISYVVEAQGSFVLPAHDYFWWDTQTAELKVLSLPGTTITVGAGAGPAQASGFELDIRELWRPLAGLLVLGTVLWLVRKQLSRLPWERGRAALSAGWQQWQRLRQPALAPTLNPPLLRSGSDRSFSHDNNAGD